MIDFEIRCEEFIFGDEIILEIVGLILRVRHSANFEGEIPLLVGKCNNPRNFWGIFKIKRKNKVFDKIIFIAQICWLLFLKA